MQPHDCSTPGFPVHHQLPEHVQTHVHRVSDAIQPSCHPLSPPSPPALSLSQHQGISQRFLFLFFLFNFILFLNLKHCISFAKHQNESATGIHTLPLRGFQNSVADFFVHATKKEMLKPLRFFPPFEISGSYSEEGCKIRQKFQGNGERFNSCFKK